MELPDADFLLNRINECPFNVHNGIQAVCVREGYAKVKVELNEHSMNIWGWPHGGVLFALGDVAAGLAAQSYGNRKAVTLSSNLNYLKSARNCKKMYGIANVQKCGRTTGFFQVSIIYYRETVVSSVQYIMFYFD